MVAQANMVKFIASAMICSFQFTAQNLQRLPLSNIGETTNINTNVTWTLRFSQKTGGVDPAFYWQIEYPQSVAIQIEANCMARDDQPATPPIA
jgi:hypothetical protein